MPGMQQWNMGLRLKGADKSVEGGDIWQALQKYSGAGDQEVKCWAFDWAAKSE
jgi:hypothetical protein